MSDRQRNGFILLIVLGVLAASCLVIATKKTVLGLDLKGGVELVYQGLPSAAQPVVTQDALQRAVDVMRERVDTLGVSEPEIQRYAGNQISVGLPNVKGLARAEQQVGTPAQLAFYDWENNVIVPGGKTTAGHDLTNTPGAQLAQTISQGAGSASTGLTLYDATTLAASLPKQSTTAALRTRPQYFLFKAKTKQPVAQTTIFADSLTDLKSGLTKAQLAGTKLITVPAGYTILEAEDQSGKTKVDLNKPTARFFVLRDVTALLGNDIRDPQQGTDTNSLSSRPDVEFKFSDKGKGQFHKVTAAIAARGQQVKLIQGLPDEQALQHFAVALDHQLISVASIDYRDLQGGIDGEQGAIITGSFTIESAQDLANLIKLGALPINLKLISSSQVSATLGKQALQQGLLAGAAGLALVVLFLLLFYRVLGLIAVAGLAVYAAYLFALIKLVPVTLTLPGIAGLILTIGVAADANIVIFERVKEEIRAGRSIPAGIAAGYKKGLSAIIDANVVTIMTAFILFILATAGVKGFAFTLGIGTIVSLLTAVLATQAVLGTMGRSRIMRGRSALGVREKTRRWRFDFMGASKYFFSMSGVILLIGALAIGGKGLHLGIDFESGTRITTALTKKADENAVRAVMTSAGFADAKVQKITNKELGSNAFQISTAGQPADAVPVQRALNAKFGVPEGKFSVQTVGPTFGQTVANSAVIAIIVSLLVISAYIALRFEWKYAVPVLIALMHDVLITAGVYSLTGREVTTSTVAALLTILGYSLYDTIIVFDRVRENVPRMPRAAFSQIVNRSMSEVLTRSLATTFCTLLPISALLFFGGDTLKDFAFALLIGVASGAYSSIFIASPVLTHWKERESTYRARHARIAAEAPDGRVPAYADGKLADAEPTRKRAPARGSITAPDQELSAAEFEALKKTIEVDEPKPKPKPKAKPRPAAPAASTRRPATPRPAPAPATPPPAATATEDGHVDHAPDEAENEGVLPNSPKPRDRRPRNRRHGRNR